MLLGIFAYEYICFWVLLLLEYAWLGRMYCGWGEVGSCVWLGVGVVQDVYMGASTLEIQKRSTGCLGSGVTGTCPVSDGN